MFACASRVMTTSLICIICLHHEPPAASPQHLSSKLSKANSKALDSAVKVEARTSLIPFKLDRLRECLHTNLVLHCVAFTPYPFKIPSKCLVVLPCCTALAGIFERLFNEEVLQSRLLRVNAVGKLAIANTLRECLDGVLCNPPTC